MLRRSLEDVQQRLDAAKEVSPKYLPNSAKLNLRSTPSHENRKQFSTRCCDSQPSGAATSREWQTLICEVSPVPLTTAAPTTNLRSDDLQLNVVDIPACRAQLADLENQAEASDLWDSPTQAQALMQSELTCAITVASRSRNCLRSRVDIITSYNNTSCWPIQVGARAFDRPDRISMSQTKSGL
eukprot:7204583-Pyramimonas_sp.AAC.1